MVWADKSGRAPILRLEFGKVQTRSPGCFDADILAAPEAKFTACGPKSYKYLRFRCSGSMDKPPIKSLGLSPHPDLSPPLIQSPLV